MPEALQRPILESSSASEVVLRMDRVAEDENSTLEHILPKASPPQRCS
jgi:hypothetical protein